MNSVELEWRFRRLSKMSAAEVGWRISDHVRRKRWASQQVMPGVSASVLGVRSPWTCRARLGIGPGCHLSCACLPRNCCGPFRTTRAESVIAAAEEMLAGRWELLGVAAPGHGGSGLVLRSGDREARTSGRLLLQGQSPIRGRHGKREADLGALAHAPPHGARGSLRSFRRRTLRRARRLASPFLVGAEPFSLRRALDKRDRGRAAADQLGLGAPTARRVGRGRGALRAKRGGVALRSGGTSTTSRPSAAEGRPPTITSSPRPPASWWQRSPLTGSPRAPAGAERGGTGSRARAEEQHLSQRGQPRDGLRVPRLRRRTGDGRGG